MLLDQAMKDKLIAAATDALNNIPLAPNKNHRVGAAGLTNDGHFIVGVSVAHFTGGPCAEPVVFGAAVAQGYLPHHLSHIIAVADRGRGVINPCGRCRQQMLDLSPEIHVLIRDGEEVREMSIQELLPFAFRIDKDVPGTILQYEDAKK